MATLAGVIALSVAGTSEPAIALVPAGIGAIYLGGAIHGNRAVNECHDAMNDYEQAVAARGTLANTPAPPVDESDDDQPRPRPRTRPLAPPGQQMVPQPPGQQMAPQPPGQQMAPPLPGQQMVPPPVAGPPQQPGPPPVAGPPQQPSAPQGPAGQAPPAQTRPPAAKKPPPPRDDEWSDFWREVQ